MITRTTRVGSKNLESLLSMLEASRPEAMFALDILNSAKIDVGIVTARLRNSLSVARKWFPRFTYLFKPPNHTYGSTSETYENNHYIDMITWILQYLDNRNYKPKTHPKKTGKHDRHKF